MTAVRLIDEEVDDLEKYDFSGIASPIGGSELSDKIDLYRQIDKLQDEQRAVVLAYLSGLTYNELGVTQKYFLYHLKKAVNTLRKRIDNDGNIPRKYITR